MMSTADLPQRAWRMLVLMRKAAGDALLVGSFIAFILVTGVFFTYLWLIIVTYALVFLLALLIRLRMAARNASELPERDETLEKADETLVSEKVRIGMMLSWRNAH